MDINKRYERAKNLLGVESQDTSINPPELPDITNTSRPPTIPSSTNYYGGMRFLQESSPIAPDKSNLEVYLEKQKAHSEELARYKEARDLEQATMKMPDGRISEGKLEEYTKWNAHNEKQLRASIQAKWMDWVVQGRKMEVEGILASLEMPSNLEQENPQRVIGSSPGDVDKPLEVGAQIQTERFWASFEKLDKKLQSK